MVFIVGGSNEDISGSIKPRMAADRHLGKLHRHRAVSLRDSTAFLFHNARRLNAALFSVPSKHPQNIRLSLKKLRTQNMAKMQIKKILKVLNKKHNRYLGLIVSVKLYNIKYLCCIIIERC